MKDKLQNRVVRHMKRLITQYKIDARFSRKMANRRIIAELSEFLKLNTISTNNWNYVHSFIIEYLSQTVSGSIAKYCNLTVTCQTEKIAPIWVCWWQGEDNAPALVRYCIKRIIAYSGPHPVNLITKETVNNYIKIPTKISEMIKQGKIGMANVADYVRCLLLKEYGGLWIDATVFLYKEIPDDFFRMEFYSANGERYQGRYISGGRWTTYVIGGYKNSKLFSFLVDAFEEYYDKNESTIDYFLIDYLIECAYENFPDVRNAIESVPLNSKHRFELRNAMLKEVTKKDINNYLYEDTVFYKLSYKSKYGLKDAFGNKTFYAELIEEFERNT